jgi:antitoxin component YwqK of YwqJK toxin-antitoxin module
MKRNSVYFLVIVLIAITPACRKHQINRFDADQRKQGLWHEHSQLGTLMAYGEYRDGQEHGKWVHLDPEGRTWVTYRYGTKKIRVKYYYASGKLERKGWARMEQEPQGPHFYWHGRWVYFDPEGGRDTTIQYRYGAPLP